MDSITPVSPHQRVVSGMTIDTYGPNRPVAYHVDASCGRLHSGATGERTITTITVYADGAGDEWAVYNPNERAQHASLYVRPDGSRWQIWWRRVFPCAVCVQHRVDLALQKRQEWVEKGACWGTEEPGFFEGPNSGRPPDDLTEGQRRALGMCEACPVRAECRDFGRTLHRASGGVPGIFGGETETQRNHILG